MERLSVSQYREQNYLPDAMNNYLCLLGWSHPEEKDIFSKEEITDILTYERFSKSAALYDIEKLNGLMDNTSKDIELMKLFNVGH